jgi:hypothetical protein
MSSAFSDYQRGPVFHQYVFRRRRLLQLCESPPRPQVPNPTLTNQIAESRKPRRHRLLTRAHEATEPRLLTRAHEAASSIFSSQFQLTQGITDDETILFSGTSRSTGCCLCPLPNWYWGGRSSSRGKQGCIGALLVMILPSNRLVTMWGRLGCSHVDWVLPRCFLIQFVLILVFDELPLKRMRVFSLYRYRWDGWDEEAYAVSVGGA